MAVPRPIDATPPAPRSRRRVVNCKKKGTVAERKTIRVLEAAGFVCTKAGGSLGIFDVVGIGAACVRLIQCKAGSSYLSAIEREQIAALVVPENVTRECWRWPDRARAPLIEVL